MTDHIDLIALAILVLIAGWALLRNHAQPTATAPTVLQPMHICRPDLSACRRTEPTRTLLQGAPYVAASATDVRATWHRATVHAKRLQALAKANAAKAASAQATDPTIDLFTEPTCNSLTPI